MELIATRGYFFCRYCGSFYFPDTKPEEGIRIIGETPEKIACAICTQPLSAAMLDETHPIRYCCNCRGVLLARTSFAGVVQKRRSWALDTPAPPVPLNQAEFDRKVRCPVCSAAMATHPYYGPGNVVIDSCERCELVWLDFGELKQIVNAPGKDRGTREVVKRSASEEPIGGVTGGRILGSGSTNALDVLDVLALLDNLF